MQFDGGSDGQLRALLVTHPADVAQPEEPVGARGGKPGLALVRMESLKVDTERNLDEASSSVGELTRGVVRGDDDHVEGLGETAIQGADSGGDADPAFKFDDPQSGVYDIWIGVYGEAATAEATLTISER